MRKLIFSTFFSLVFLFLLPASVHAATLYWVGDDGANASVASNWKTTNPTTCGGGDSGAAPASGDTINFDADCDNGASWDTSASSAVTTFTMNSGYAGTVTLARSLSVSGTTTISSGILDSSTQALVFAALTVSGGTATLGSSSSLSASGTVTLSSGSLTLPSGADLNGALTISAGTFNAPSGTMTLAGSLTISGTPTFNANGGTITFDSASGTLACNNVTFSTVAFDNTGTKTVNSDCSLPLGASPTLNGSSSIVLNGILSGSGTLTKGTSTLTLNAGSSLTGFSGLNLLNFTVAGATADFSAYTSFSTGGPLTLSSGTLSLPSGADLNSTLVISNGTFNAPSGTMTLALGLTISGSPVFNANGGTITFDGTNATLSCNNVTFNLVNLTGSNKTINSNCNLPLGNNPSTTGNITSLLGTLSGTGTLTISGSLNTIGSTGAFSGFTGFAIGSVSFTISGATLDFSGYSTFTQAGNTITLNSGSLTLPNGADLNGNLSISGGTFNAPSGTMTLAGALTISGSPIFNANGGTFTFDGGSGSVTLTCNNVVFNSVIFNGTGTKVISSNCSLPLGTNPSVRNNITNSGTLSGSGTVTFIGSSFGSYTHNSSTSVLSGFSGIVTTNAFINTNSSTLDLSNYTAVDFNGSFTVSSGTFTAPSGTMSVAGNFTVSGGTFAHNSGTLLLDGTNQTLSGAISFYNLSKTVSSAATLTFPSSTTQTISGTLTLQGSSGNNLSLRSSTSGTQWNIDPQGARVISNVDVKDSNNINATVIPAGAGGVDSGNNIGWSFSTSPITFNLDSPGDQDYINNDRPTFKWKAATDNAGSSISGYDLNIDNGSSGSWSITNIPSSGTTDYVTSKYVVHFDNFADSDTTNNYISVYTKSSTDWSTDSNSGQNDGKLKEGRRVWTITAHDSAGNSQAAGRTLFVDQTNPSLTNLKLSSTSFSGRLTDTLSANDGNTSTQNEDGPKIASGPRLVEIKIVKKGDFVVNIDKLYWTCDDTQITDNTKQKCDKHHDFYFTPTPKLTAGTYQVTLTGKDHAGNSTTLSTFSLSVGSGGSQSTVLDPVSSQDEPLPAIPAENTPATETALPIQAPVHKSLLSFILDIFKAIKTFILNLISWFVKLFTA